MKRAEKRKGGRSLLFRRKFSPNELRRRGDEAALNRVKRRLELRADRANRRNNGDRDKRRDKAVFNGRRAVFVVDELIDKSFHESTPACYSYACTADWALPPSDCSHDAICKLIIGENRRLIEKIVRLRIISVNNR